MSDVRAAALRSACAIVLVCMAATSVQAGLPGLPDPGFGDNGLVVIDAVQADNSAVSIAVTTQHRVLVGGLLDSDGLVTSMAARLWPDGTFDAQFGRPEFGAGRAPVITQPSTTGTLHVNAGFAVLSDGTPVYAASYLADGAWRAHVGRCADLRCNGTGYGWTAHIGEGVQLSFPPAVVDATALGIHVDAYDNIVVVGRADYADEGSCAGWIARLRPDLALDPQFGLPIHHVRLVAFAEQCSELRAVATLASGEIVAVGRHVRHADPQDNGQFLVVRLDDDGSDASGFNAGVPLRFDFGTAPGEDAANAVAIDPDGRIVVAGQTQYLQSADDDYAIARLLPDGSFDSGFSDDGRLVLAWDDGGDREDIANAVLIDQLRRIVVTGSYRTASALGARGIGTARLHDDGVVDATFDGGKSYLHLGTDVDAVASAIALDARGGLLIGGTTNIAHPTRGIDAFVLRVQGDFEFGDGFED